MNIEQELNAYIKEAADNTYTQKSENWRSLFAQREDDKSFDFSEMESFLSTSSRAASGVGDMVRFNLRLKPALDYLGEKLDNSLLQKVNGSKVGNPPQVTINSVTSNLAHLWNLSRVEDYVEHLYLLKEQQNEALDILEIGPGYGCGAHILISLGLVKSYTCVDLSENLGNSVFFLSRNYPDWNVNFCRSWSDLCTRFKNLNFVLASGFNNLEKVQFDAVINTDSFGEMPANTAKLYIQKIPHLLRESGLFISMNGHRRGQYELTGVNKVSDYGYENFEIDTFSYKSGVSDYGYENFEIDTFSYKSGFSSSMDDFGHLAVCKRRHTSIPVKAAIIDVLGDLFAMGLNKDVDWVLKRLNNSSLDESDFLKIEDWDEALNEGEINERDKISEYVKFVRGAIEHSDFDRNVYQNLLIQIESPQAQYILRLCRLICFAEWGFWQNENFNKTLTFLMSDVERFKNASKLKKMMFLFIRREHLKKKFFSRRNFKVPLILKVRRLVEPLISFKR